MPILLETLKKYRTKAEIFIETGTHVGNTVRMADKLAFKKIYTIELADHFYKRAQKEFANRSHIIPIFGDSTVEIPNILKELNEPALFWLDGHWSDGDTARGPVDVPLYQELEAIAKHPVKTHTIMVDDTRLMGGEWKDISLDKVKELLLKINKDYKFSFEDGYLDVNRKIGKFPNDILIAHL